MENAAPLFGLAALVLSLSCLVHVGVGAWIRWRAAEHAERPPAPDEAAWAAALCERLARVERALEAQGIEIERLGEAQRHAARLLTERVGARAEGGGVDRPAARIATPH